MEVVPDDVRPPLGGAEVRPKTGDHLLPMLWPLTPKRIRLHILVQVLVGIQVGAVRREEEEPELFPVAREPLLHLP